MFIAYVRGPLGRAEDVGSKFGIVRYFVLSIQSRPLHWLTFTLSLAQAEMHLTLATIFRRFDTELFKTSRREVDPKKDFFVPVPESRNGVRVLVR